MTLNLQIGDIIEVKRRVKDGLFIHDEWLLANVLEVEPILRVQLRKTKEFLALPSMSHGKSWR